MEKNSEFLSMMDNSFRMKSVEWLESEIKKNMNLTILDLRAEKAFINDKIEGSINILLKDLPERYSELNKNNTIISLCNGSVQSAYAIMFLFSKGFNDVYNLSGGFSKWTKYREEKKKNN